MPSPRPEHDRDVQRVQRDVGDGGERGQARASSAATPLSASGERQAGGEHAAEHDGHHDERDAAGTAPRPAAHPARPARPPPRRAAPRRRRAPRGASMARSRARRRRPPPPWASSERRPLITTAIAVARPSSLRHGRAPRRRRRRRAGPRRRPSRRSAPRRRPRSRRRSGRARRAGRRRWADSKRGRPVEVGVERREEGAGGDEADDEDGQPERRPCGGECGWRRRRVVRHGPIVAPRALGMSSGHGRIRPVHPAVGPTRPDSYA